MRQENKLDNHGDQIEMNTDGIFLQMCVAWTNASVIVILPQPIIV